jgi:hypothetical protein
MTFTVSDSPTVSPIKDADTVTDAVSPPAIVAAVADADKVSELGVIVADEGPVERSPSPSEATRIDAKRLNVNFDIFFLSLVDSETFSKSAS